MRICDYSLLFKPKLSLSDQQAEMDALRKCFADCDGLKCPAWLEKCVAKELQKGTMGKEARFAVYRQVYKLLKVSFIIVDCNFHGSHEVTDFLYRKNSALD